MNIKVSTMKNQFLIGVVVALLIGAGAVVTSCSPKSPEQWVITCEDDLLKKMETSDKEFRKSELGNLISYKHSRMIDEAIVEKDSIRYVFDKNTKELIEKDVRWRDDLPEHLPPIISKEQAESMVGGEIQFSRLVFISPDSDVHPVKPTPENPCWTVRILDNIGFVKDVIIIDAVEGKILGHGVPPP